MGDATRLRRVVALLQRSLGAIFNNASVKRRNHRYIIRIAVYEKPLPGVGQGYRMSAKQIRAWVKQAADRIHPKLYRRMAIEVEPWTTGRFSHKLFCPVNVIVDARQGEGDVNEGEEDFERK